MAFTHIATFAWKDSVDAAGHGRLLARALESYIATVEGVEHYWCGPDAGFSPGTSDFAVVGRFASLTAFANYRDSEAHQRILNDLIIPWLDRRSVVQLEDR